MQIMRCKKRDLCVVGGIAILLVLWSFATFAEARAGRGGSAGSRGSRSFSAPAQPSTPPGSTFGQRPPSSPSQRADDPLSRSTPLPQSSPFGGGGFWRSIGGGLLGGFIGSMLFSSLGFAGYGAGGAGGGWGGPGLFDLLLLGLIGYIAYRFFFKRPSQTNRYESGPADEERHRGFDRYAAQEPALSPPVQERDLDRGLAQVRALDPEFDPARFCDQAMDFFFRLQAAWSARDLSPLRPLITDELFAQLQAEVDQLRRERKINRVENIAVRTVELTEAWQEAGQDFVTVYFYANCLDYDIDEVTGEVVRGSKFEPTKFEEYWTFSRPVGGSSWKLSAITQAQASMASAEYR